MLHPDYQIHLAEIDLQRRIAAAHRRQEYRAGISRARAWLTRVFRGGAAAPTAHTGPIADPMSSAAATECR